MISDYIIYYQPGYPKSNETLKYAVQGCDETKEFLIVLLEGGYRIVSIWHDGDILQTTQADQLILKAAEWMAARRICKSLQLGECEEKVRFGFETGFHHTGDRDLLEALPFKAPEWGEKTENGTARKLHVNFMVGADGVSCDSSLIEKKSTLSEI